MKENQKKKNKIDDYGVFCCCGKVNESQIDYKKQNHSSRSFL